MNSLTSIKLGIASEPDQLELVEMHIARGPPVELRIQGHLFGSGLFTGNDAFEALVALRLHLEQNGYRLLCNAARKDAYPSRMSREMSWGRKVYLFESGKQARREDLVNAFDLATYDQVGTVVEQRSNYEAWIRSLE